jgi:hypothetical protein
MGGRRNKFETTDSTRVFMILLMVVINIIQNNGSEIVDGLVKYPPENR